MNNNVDILQTVGVDNYVVFFNTGASEYVQDLLVRQGKIADLCVRVEHTGNSHLLEKLGHFLCQL